MAVSASDLEFVPDESYNMENVQRFDLVKGTVTLEAYTLGYGNQEPVCTETWTPKTTTLEGKDQISGFIDVVTQDHVKDGVLIKAGTYIGWGMIGMEVEYTITPAECVWVGSNTGTKSVLIGLYDIAFKEGLKGSSYLMSDSDNLTGTYTYAVEKPLTREHRRNTRETTTWNFTMPGVSSILK